MNNFFNKNIQKKQIFALFLLLFLSISLWAGVSLVQKIQELRKEAVGTGEILVSVLPASLALQRGQTVNVSIRLLNSSTTKTFNLFSAGVDLDYSQDYFTVSNVTCNSGFLSQPAKATSDTTKIYLDCYNPGGIAPKTLAPSGQTTLGSFNLTVKNTAPGSPTSLTVSRTKIPDANSYNDLANAGTGATFTLPCPMITSGKSDLICDGVTTQRGIVWTWDGPIFSKGSGNYVIQVDNNSDHSSPEYTGTVDSPTYGVKNIGSGDWYARVKVNYSSCPSPWVTLPVIPDQPCHINTPAPPTPTSSLPLCASPSSNIPVVVSPDCIYSKGVGFFSATWKWTAVSHAKGYELNYSAVPFEQVSTYFSTVTTLTEYTSTNLISGTYYARVRVSSADGTCQPNAYWVNLPTFTKDCYPSY